MLARCWVGEEPLNAADGRVNQCGCSGNWYRGSLKKLSTELPRDPATPRDPAAPRAVHWTESNFLTEMLGTTLTEALFMLSPKAEL